MDIPVRAHIERLLDAHASDGLSEAVEQAFRAVPRHLFIPPVALACRDDGPQIIDRDADPDAWWDAVYSRASIVTQLDDGATDIRAGSGDYTCSSSAPSTVADLLQRLELAPGHRVLEIGTGTGWTAALLSHLVGAANVTSVEVDPVLGAQAASNLAASGHAPYLVVGDGALGCPERAPYDRVHVTCGIRRVPYAWIEQSRPGAVIVLPYCPGFGTDHALRLVVTPDGMAYGRFPGFASYMTMRAQRPQRDQPARTDADKHHLTTRVDPRTIGHAPAGADLAIAALTGLDSLGQADQDEDGPRYRLWVSDPAVPRSWAVAVWRPGQDEYQIYQVGDRPVWEEVVAAYFRWVGWGEPGRDRFGMTVHADGQEVWLDTPDQVIGSEARSAC
ncbi:protein-L-isoaspartate(D-aspartate) O-methyltransferase [Thermocatellispora tengchongensis]|uniref:Protein-L-isoaspartate O-methyltransferase n=1 Tax=Thermocatellispora tengchongensis TaxID=1073253 RepID=A0A840NUZ0_9ACTN|nr:protein-L-isoaspartate(D-aspartate) O-methyltransferase [Thermocatellispora tengchongensis]MBB5132584.1 protein-L-isoaspartate(D-aspartate) O-methyltransferase [Thermocatellispora tengchongensis]